MSDKKSTNLEYMEGNFYERLCYFWKLSKVDLYNPGPSQIVDDIIEKEKAQKN
jgi:hypothetical protein